VCSSDLYSDSIFYAGTQILFQRSDSTTVYELNAADSTERTMYTIDTNRVVRFGLYPLFTYEGSNVLGIQSKILKLTYIYSFQGACPGVFRNYASPFGFLHESTSCSWGSSGSNDIIGAVLNNKRYGTIFTIPTKIANAVVSVQQDLGQTNTVFPNPSTGRIYVQTADKVVVIRVLSLHGMELHKQNVLTQEENDRYSLDINLPSGIYFIEVIGEKTHRYHKIVKE
jgi:hypothetical protein